MYIYVQLSYGMMVEPSAFRRHQTQMKTMNSHSTYTYVAPRLSVYLHTLTSTCMCTIPGVTLWAPLHTRHIVYLHTYLLLSVSWRSMSTTVCMYVGSHQDRWWNCLRRKDGEWVWSLISHLLTDTMTLKWANSTPSYHRIWCICDCSPVLIFWLEIQTQQANLNLSQ